MRVFWDERGHLVNENQLADEYSDAIRHGYIDKEITFPQYVRNCQSIAGGTLDEIKNEKETKK